MIDLSLAYIIMIKFDYDIFNYSNSFKLKMNLFENI